MNRRILAVLTMMLLALLLGSLLAACGAKDETAVSTTEEQQEEAAPVTLDGQSLVEERCTRCHDLGRVERAKKFEELDGEPARVSL